MKGTEACLSVASLTQGNDPSFLTNLVFEAKLRPPTSGPHPQGAPLNDMRGKSRSFQLPKRKEQHGTETGFLQELQHSVGHEFCASGLWRCCSENNVAARKQKNRSSGSGFLSMAPLRGHGGPWRCTFQVVMHSSTDARIKHLMWDLPPCPPI